VSCLICRKCFCCIVVGANSERLLSFAIEGGIVEIEITLIVYFVLCDPEAIAKALEMHDLAGTQEADDVLDIGVVGKTQDVIIGQARFLFGGEVFVNVGKDVAGNRDCLGGEGVA